VALFPKHGTDYCLQMGKLENLSLSGSRTLNLMTFLSLSLAKASSSWIASFSRLFQISIVECGRPRPIQRSALRSYEITGIGQAP